MTEYSEAVGRESEGEGEGVRAVRGKGTAHLNPSCGLSS